MENLDIVKITELANESFENMRPEHLQKMSPEVFEAMTPEQKASISKEAMTGLTKEHIDKIPKEELSYLFKADKLAGLNPELIHELDMDYLDADEVKQMSDEDAFTFFHNLDDKKISRDEAELMLPENWEIDAETGDLEPPLGAKLHIKEITQVYKDSSELMDDEIPKIIGPSVPNLKMGRGLGGTGTPVMDHMRDSLSKKFALNLLQDDNGVLHVEDKSENGEVNNRFSFLPDSNNITQVDKNSISSELSVEQGCFYSVTTSQGQKIKVLPTIKDQNDLSKVINNGQIVYGEEGEIFMDVPKNTRDGETSRVSAIVDPFIEPAPEAGCIDTTDANGVALCTAGVSFSNTKDKHQTAKITYSDGTSQKLMPTVFKPSALIDIGVTIPGVESIIFNADGTFTTVHLGQKYILRPNFNVNTMEVPQGQKVKPKLIFNEKGSLIYTVGVDLASKLTTQQLALKFDLSIEPFVKELCTVN